MCMGKFAIRAEVGEVSTSANHVRFCGGNRIAWFLESSLKHVTTRYTTLQHVTIRYNTVSGSHHYSFLCTKCLLKLYNTLQHVTIRSNSGFHPKGAFWSELSRAIEYWDHRTSPTPYCLFSYCTCTNVDSLLLVGLISTRTTVFSARTCAITSRLLENFSSVVLLCSRLFRSCPYSSYRDPFSSRFC